MNIQSNAACDPYWEHADWLPPWYILDQWCQQDDRCKQAKQQALFTACEKGIVFYRRNDGKDFDDPVHELSRRGILLIDRASFTQWAEQVEGKSPVDVPPQARPAYPVWASPDAYRFDESQWKWIPDSAPTLPAPQISVITAPFDGEPVLISDASDSDSVSDAAQVEAKPADDIYPSDAELRERGVTTEEIIAAFMVKPDRRENDKWWRDRLSNTPRYKKLKAALVQKGKASRGGQRFPSWWSPALIASWLFRSGHMTQRRALDVLAKKFPDWAQHPDFL